MFATKLKVAFALFLSFFIIWLALILLGAQPDSSVHQIQFSNLTILSLFLGSAAFASVLSMIIGLDLLGFEMKPTSLKKKFGRVRVKLHTRKLAAASLKQQKKDSTVQLEKLQPSQAKLDADTPSLEEEILLPDRSLSISKEVAIKKPKKTDKATEEGLIQLKANMLSHPPKITTYQKPSFKKKTHATVLKRDSEDDSNRISCPKCSKVFSIALLSLDFSSGKPKMIRSCPHCYSALTIPEDDETAVTKIKGDRKPVERSREEQKAFFLFGETKFKSCKFKPGYLGSLPGNKPIPDECFGCPQLVECFHALKTIQ